MLLFWFRQIAFFSPEYCVATFLDKNWPIFSLSHVAWNKVLMIAVHIMPVGAFSNQVGTSLFGGP